MGLHRGIAVGRFLADQKRSSARMDVRGGALPIAYDFEASNTAATYQRMVVKRPIAPGTE